MRFLFTIIFLFVTLFLLAGNIDTVKSSKRHQFSFEFGIQQRSYFGDKYIYPYHDTIIPMVSRVSSTEYYGFSYAKNTSWHLGFLYYYKLFQKIKLNSGLELVNRKTILTCPTDTVIKYHSPSSVYKYVFNEYHFEIPIFVEISLKKFNFDLGGSFSVFYIPSTRAYSFDGSAKNVHGFWNNDIFSSAFRFSYEFELTKKFNIRIYTGVEYLSCAAINTSANTFDFRFGTALLF